MALRNNVDELFRRGGICIQVQNRVLDYCIDPLSLCRNGRYGATYPAGERGVVSPVSDHANIRMDSEQVIMRLEEDHYSVDAEFIFYNTSETVTELVGFPKVYYLTTREHEGPTNYMRFETWVNGEKAEIINSDPDDKPMTGKISIIWLRKGLLRKGLRSHHKKLSSGWFIVLNFRVTQFTKIRNRYQSRYSVLFEQVKASYIVGTGRHWKDRIGKAVFIRDGPGVGGAENVKFGFPMAPGPRLISSGLLVSEIRNIKPEPRAALTVRILRRKE